MHSLFPSSQGDDVSVGDRLKIVVKGRTLDLCGRVLDANRDVVRRQRKRSEIV